MIGTIEDDQAEASEHVVILLTMLAATDPELAKKYEDVSNEIYKGYYDGIEKGQDEDHLFYELVEKLNAHGDEIQDHLFTLYDEKKYKRLYRHRKLKGKPTTIRTRKATKEALIKSILRYAKQDRECALKHIELERENGYKFFELKQVENAIKQSLLGEQK